MRILINILILTILAGCSGKQSTSKANSKEQAEALVFPTISVIDARFPLKIDDLNFHDSSNFIRINDGIERRIQQAIYDYYFDECAGDSSETYFTLSDTYLKTIRLQDDSNSIFLILLKHMPTGATNSKILFFDNKSKKFIGKAVDFNLWALYDNENGTLKPSNLKEELKIDTPEIELVDYDKDGIHDFKFTRLYHNGTENAIESTILNVINNKIDTLDFKQTGI